MAIEIVDFPIKNGGFSFMPIYYSMVLEILSSLSKCPNWVGVKSPNVVRQTHASVDNNWG